MKSKILWAVAVVCLLARPAAAQFTVSSPSGSTTVKAADDFATRAFQDPWDMNQRTDLGWWLYGSDFPPSNFVNPVFSGGIFTATISGQPGRLFLLDSDLLPEAGVPTSVPTGKTGGLYPIDATKYTHLVYRMSSSVAGVSQYIWSNQTMYQDQTIGVEVAQNQTVVQTGWKIYDVNMTTLTPQSSGLGSPFAWGSTIRSLQILPNAAVSSGTIQLDWVRLVQDNDPTLKKQIAWTGGTADIYLDNDNNAANGTLGRIAVNATSPYTFFVGALPAGTYYVAVHSHTAGETPGSSGNFFYSPGSWTVNDIPTVTLTTPSDEGSSDDFATTKLGTPWVGGSPFLVDNTLAGFSGTFNVANAGPASVALTNEAGTALGAQTVYFGTGLNGDPEVYTLYFDGKGRQVRIDPSHYRLLTLDVGIPNLARSLVNGSIGRIIWRAAADASQGAGGLAVTEQFALNSAAGENTVAHITMDLSKVPLVQGATSATWTSAIATSQGIDAFRWDPHEFAGPTNFFVKRIKLTALERTQGDQFTFKWTSSKTGTVTIFYDQDPNHSFAGTMACTVTNAPAGAGSCQWTVPPALPPGEYQVYATINDGTNLNEVYARTNVIVDHSNSTQAVNLDKTSLNYAQLGAIHTSPQVVRLTTSGAGATPCWTAAPNAVGFLSISQTSGCGSANISIGVAGFFPAGSTTTLFVTITPTNGDWTSQNIAVNVTGLTSSTGPTGSMDTPTDGSLISGSVAVTGWAMDDVEVTSVAICRDPIPAETTTPTLCAGQPEVFIGNGTFVDGARPDVQAVDPTLPMNTRAGWGYLLLSNFLPNQGNVGPIRLYAWASDADGHTALIGSKTVTANNQAAIKPFGAIDTPAQGGVVCGSSYVNFGWALTQSGKDVFANSSTIQVFIDGVFVGQPGPRSPRSDITAAFPNLDTTHAVGAFIFDTTQLSNGVHTIFWIVTDTGGQADGIGSRFFTVSNPCGS